MLTGRPRSRRTPLSRALWALLPALTLSAVAFLPASGIHALHPGDSTVPVLQIFAVAAADRSVELCFRAVFRAGEGGLHRAAPIAQELRDSGWEVEVVPREEFTAMNAVFRSGEGSGTEVVLPAAIAGPGSIFRCDTRDRTFYSVREFEFSYRPTQALLRALVSDEPPTAGTTPVPGETPATEEEESLGAVVTLTLESPGYLLGTDAEARAGRGLYWELDWKPGSVLAAGARTLSVHSGPTAAVAGGSLASALGLLFVIDEARRSRRARHAPRRRRPEVPSGGRS